MLKQFVLLEDDHSTQVQCYHQSEVKTLLASGEKTETLFENAQVPSDCFHGYLTACSQIENLRIFLFYIVLFDRTAESGVTYCQLHLYVSKKIKTLIVESREQLLFGQPGELSQG